MNNYGECRLLAQGEVSDDLLKKLKVQFIRGQDEIALYEKKGNGKILTAWEAYKNYPRQIFEEILQYGTAVLSISAAEPSTTLREQRKTLGYSQEYLANKANISLETIKKVESDQWESDFKTIEKLCKMMNLDEYTISHIPFRKQKNSLSCRLKTAFSDHSISEDDILRMTECAWIADKQQLLQTWLKEDKSLRTTKDENYGNPSYPAYKVGYDLAHKTRKLLNISQDIPIKSLREICRKINIPYMQAELSPRIAAVTVATDKTRCIIANIRGNNENPLIRRIAVAHELAHLLWDSDKNLQNLNINLYEDLETWNLADLHFIEQRANAFAVEFLMPSQYIRDKKKNETLEDYIREIMITYGTSFISTKYHLQQNGKIIAKDSINGVKTNSTDNWNAMEDFTLDYFPIATTPTNRRGFFAYIVCKAFTHNLISSESAANCLECQAELIRQNANTIIELFDDN